MSDKGFLTTDQEKKLAQLIDEAIKAKGLLELIDGYAARVVLSLLDDNLLAKVKVPDTLKPQIAALIDAAIAEDVDKAEENASDILNSLVDIPGLDEDAEGTLIEGAVKLIVGAVISIVRKKAAAK